MRYVSERDDNFFSSHSCEFYWPEHNATVSVYEYFFIKYGFELNRPHDRLVYFDGATDNYDMTDASNLFPMELTRVSID
ncbi:hypothetical protein B9Z55_027570 [Caenorhabditis nigoni]|uniref:Uncharacterized protein n=1 Tax=Caenorhabditis nigoni TaxID=1611254 RepID=A0A2G5SFA9_9PELO|nr:hypothetical protein B9Z55_027570 [Caenorhabditis nigoni]